MTDDLEQRLREYRPTNEWGDGVHHVICDEAADAIARLRAENEALQAENFKLAAGACNVEGGLIGDDHGHFDCSLKARIEALEREQGWYDIATAPTDEPFLAAVEVINNKTGHRHWEQHVIWIDSETGDVSHDTDAGWSAGDYTHWRPLPPPPTGEAA